MRIDRPSIRPRDADLTATEARPHRARSAREDEEQNARNVQAILPLGQRPQALLDWQGQDSFEQQGQQRVDGLAAGRVQAEPGGDDGWQRADDSPAVERATQAAPVNANEAAWRGEDKFEPFQRNWLETLLDTSGARPPEDEGTPAVQPVRRHKSPLQALVEAFLDDDRRNAAEGAEGAPAI